MQNRIQKPMYPINPELMDYLEKNHRLTISDLAYDDDLLRFQIICPFMTKQTDTLWLNVCANLPTPNRELISTKLHGFFLMEMDVLLFESDSIHFCTFGNSNHLELEAKNILNDNYTGNFYIKKQMLPRIYGLD